MTALILKWTSESDILASNGRRYELRSTKTARLLATCVYEPLEKANNRWRARYDAGLRTITMRGRTADMAITRLERELDKRSIGLFGVDDILFDHAC